MTESKKDRLLFLRRLIVRCVKCPLYEKRIHAVPGEGNPEARIVCVGEAPGRQEDKHGIPFCGRSGDFCNEVLSLAGLDRQAVFVTSIVKCRPPNNRNPHKHEFDTCRQLWLLKQIWLYTGSAP